MMKKTRDCRAPMFTDVFGDIGCSRPLDTNLRFPRDIFITMLMSTSIIVVKNLVVFPTADFLIERLDVDRRLGFGRRKKFRVSFWKAFFYTLTSFYGYFALRNERWTGSLKGHMETWETGRTPHKILFHYHLEFSYYLVELFYLFNEHVYKDFWQMFFHHVLTLQLIVTSYGRDVLRYGVVIMVIHDISDPFLEICKLINYVYDTSITTFMFVCFTSVFIISRLGIYAFCVALPGSIAIWRREFEWTLYSIIPQLLGLVVMHVIWSLMIVRMAVRVVRGSRPKDTRSVRTSDAGKPENIHIGKS